jgi:inosine triphosphate pyrophosphatase
MKQKLAIVTGNPLKFREIKAFLEDYFDCEQVKLSEGYEIQGTPEEILDHKLRSAYKKLGIPVLVDDTSLHFDFLGGFPGPYAKDFFERLTPYEIGVKFQNTRIKACCRIAICHGEGDKTLAYGEVNGIIIKPDNNDHHGREFDLFFQPDSMNMPMIQLSTEEKNKISHRGNALRDLVGKLKQRNN